MNQHVTGDEEDCKVRMLEAGIETSKKEMERLEAVLKQTKEKLAAEAEARKSSEIEGNTDNPVHEDTDDGGNAEV